MDFAHYTLNRRWNPLPILLLLRFMFAEKDVGWSFHTGGSLDGVDKHGFKLSSLWRTFPHTFPGFWVRNESALQTISLSNTLALTDRHRQTFQSHGNSQVWILLMRGECLCRAEIGRLIPKWSLQQFEKPSRRWRYRNYNAIKKWFIVGVRKVGKNFKSTIRKLKLTTFFAVFDNMWSSNEFIL